MHHVSNMAIPLKNMIRRRIFLMVVKGFVIEMLLSLFDQTTDFYSVIVNWRSSTLLLNYVSYGQCLSLIVHNIFSTIHGIYWIQKIHVNYGAFPFLWGSEPRRIGTIAVFLSGFGNLALKIDHVIDAVREAKNSYRDAGNTDAIDTVSSANAHSTISAEAIHIDAEINDSIIANPEAISAADVTAPYNVAADSLAADDSANNVASDTPAMVEKQRIIIAANLIHVLLESFPQSIIQAGIILYGDDRICLYELSELDRLQKYLEDTYVSEGIPAGVSKIISKENIYLNESERNCSCRYSILETSKPNVFCSWEVENFFPYLCTATSFFSVIVAIVNHGFLEAWKIRAEKKETWPSSQLRKSSTISPQLTMLRKLSIIFIGFVSSLCAYCIGLFMIYSASFSLSLTLVLLFPFFFFNIFPPNILNVILSQIFLRKRASLLGGCYGKRRRHRDKKDESQIFSFASSFWFIILMSSIFHLFLLVFEKRDTFMKTRTEIFPLLRNNHPIIRFELYFESRTDIHGENKYNRCTTIHGLGDTRFISQAVHANYPKSYPIRIQEEGLRFNRFDVYVMNDKLISPNGEQKMVMFLFCILPTTMFHILYLYFTNPCSKRMGKILTYLAAAITPLIFVAFQWNRVDDHFNDFWVISPIFFYMLQLSWFLLRSMISSLRQIPLLIFIMVVFAAPPVTIYWLKMYIERKYEQSRLTLRDTCIEGLIQARNFDVINPVINTFFGVFETIFGIGTVDKEKVTSKDWIDETKLNKVTKSFKMLFFYQYWKMRLFNKAYFLHFVPFQTTLIYAAFKIRHKQCEECWKLFLFFILILGSFTPVFFNFHELTRTVKFAHYETVINGTILFSNVTEITIDDFVHRNLSSIERDLETLIPSMLNHIMNCGCSCEIYQFDKFEEFYGYEHDTDKCLYRRCWDVESKTNFELLAAMTNTLEVIFSLKEGHYFFHVFPFYIMTFVYFIGQY